MTRVGLAFHNMTTRVGLAFHNMTTRDGLAALFRNPFIVVRRFKDAHINHKTRLKYKYDFKLYKALNIEY
jgi:hypothetical protein